MEWISVGILAAWVFVGYIVGRSKRSQQERNEAWLSKLDRDVEEASKDL